MASGLDQLDKGSWDFVGFHRALSGFVGCYGHLGFNVGAFTTRAGFVTGFVKGSVRDL